MDSYRDHLLLCPRINYSKRHAAVQEALACILSTAGQGFAREVALPHTPNLRPADLLLRSYQDGKDTAVDLTISHGWQVSEQAVGRERWRTFLRKKEALKES